MSQLSSIPVAIQLLLFLLIAGCNLKSGEDGFTALVQMNPESPGVNCGNGGQQINSGLDRNDDGVLEPTEVTRTIYVCHGNETTSLVDVQEEGPSASCIEGGLRISAGVDADFDGTLDPGEVRSVSYVCHGERGAAGATFIHVEPSGSNCENGGVRIQTGVDADGNGSYSEAELDSPQFVCNGEDGVNSLIRQTVLTRGSEECPGGGVRLESGLDLNRDGSLQDTEISQTTVLCAPPVCENTARFSLDTLAACPEPAPYGEMPYSLFSGAFSAVSSSGDLFLLTDNDAGANHIARISEDGTVTNDWYVGPSVGSYGGGLATLGNDLYSISPTSTAISISRIDMLTGVASPVLTLSDGAGFERRLAIFDPASIFFGGGGSTRISRVASNTTADLLVDDAYALDMVADPSRNRLYVVDNSSVRFFSLPIQPGATPELLTSLGSNLGGPDSVFGTIAVDHNGTVYVTCFKDDFGMGSAPCERASVWRIHPDTGEVTPLIDNSRIVSGMVFNRARRQLHLMRLMPGGALSLERVEILR